MTKTLFIAAIAIAALTAGCNKKPQNDETVVQKAPIEIKKEASVALLNDLSGVWSEGTALLTFYYKDGHIQLLLDDTPVIASLGDIDADNKTVNILATNKQGEQVIWTIRKVENPDSTSFRLKLTLHEGSSDTFNFVRTIGSDDLNRIQGIYRKRQKAIDDAAQEAAQEIANNTATDTQPAEDQQLAQESMQTEQTPQIQPEPDTQNNSTPDPFTSEDAPTVAN